MLWLRPGGDIFTFYIGVEHDEFREALQELAKRAGIELVNAPSLPPEVDAHRNRLIELNELAAAYYANVDAQHPAGSRRSRSARATRVSLRWPSGSAWVTPPMVMRSAAI